MSTKISRRDNASGQLADAQLGETQSLSDLCKEYGIPGFACSCDALAAVLDVAGQDPCETPGFQAACTKKHSELCDPPPGGGGGGSTRRAGFSLNSVANVALAGGIVFGGIKLVQSMQEDE